MSNTFGHCFGNHKPYKVETLSSIQCSLPRAFTEDNIVSCSILKMSTQEDCCMNINLPVRPRQEGLQCDGCNKWQHRTCNTGITQQEYRRAARCREGIDWQCEDCSNMSAGSCLPNAESTRVDETVTGKCIKP